MSQLGGKRKDQCESEKTTKEEKKVLIIITLLDLREKIGVSKGTTWIGQSIKIDNTYMIWGFKQSDRKREFKIYRHIIKVYEYYTYFNLRISGRGLDGVNIRRGGLKNRRDRKTNESDCYNSVGTEERRK